MTNFELFKECLTIETFVRLLRSARCFNDRTLCPLDGLNGNCTKEECMKAVRRWAEEEVDE